jgi:hypothetical protein
MHGPATHARAFLLAGLVAVVAAVPAAGGGASGAREQTTPVNTSRPAITGEPLEGLRLTAQPGTWTGTQPIAFAYHWLRCNRRGGSCSAISGATRQRYRLTGNDVGHTLRVRVRASNKDGAAVATSARTHVIVAADSLPVNLTPPAISGTPKVGDALTASPGTWTGKRPIAFSFQWQRCDSVGGNCAAVAGATGGRFELTGADLGRTLRVVVTARNASGVDSRTSVPTAVVASGGPAGQVRLENGKISIPVSSVSLPARLIIDQVQFRPYPVRSRTAPILVRVHISDTRGYFIRGALVFVRSTPLLTTTPPETATSLSGWVTLTTKPRLDFPLRRGFNVQFFVRARKSGENLLAGVSSRRLAQVATAPPG